MYYVGVDLGATNVRAVVGDETASIAGRARDATPQDSGRAVTDAVLRVVREACADASVDPAAVAGAGVGAMGRLDREAGEVRFSANLPDGAGPIPLVDPLAELLETDAVSLHSDTLAGAIGERFRSYPDTDDLVYLTISSGIGAGVVAGGVPLTGENGNAGEVGHATIDADGLMTCGCGREGHWEAYCSGDNVPRFARALYATDPVETALPVEDLDLTAAELFDHAGTDAFADRVVDRLADLNTAGVANVVHAYDPSVVSIGGAVALNNPDLVVEPIRRRLPDALVVDAPEVGLSDLGDRAVLEGALASALPDDGPA